MARVGKNQQKVLLLLLGSLTLGLSRFPKNYFRVIKAIKHDRKEIDRRALEDAINSLYKSQLVKAISNKDRTVTMVLSKEGKRSAITYNIDEMSIDPPDKWDGHWRIVIYDIPVRLRIMRDSIRMHLQELGFYEFQQSVFVHPYDCLDQLDFLIEHYSARRHVRCLTADYIDNELDLKRNFDLIEK